MLLVSSFLKHFGEPVGYTAKASHCFPTPHFCITLLSFRSMLLTLFWFVWGKKKAKTFPQCPVCLSHFPFSVSNTSVKTVIWKNLSLHLLLFSKSHLTLLWPHGLQHTRLPCPSPSPEFAQTHVHWVDDAIQPFSSSVASFSPWPQSFPASGSFPMNQLFAPSGQSIGASTSASVFPINIQGYFPLGLTGLISLLSKGLSRVLSSTTVRKHQFFSTQPSHIHTWLSEKP